MIARNGLVRQARPRQVILTNCNPWWVSASIVSVRLRIMRSVQRNTLELESLDHAGVWKMSRAMENTLERNPTSIWCASEIVSINRSVEIAQKWKHTGIFATKLWTTLHICLALYARLRNFNCNVPAIADGHLNTFNSSDSNDCKNRWVSANNVVTCAVIHHTPIIGHIIWSLSPAAIKAICAPAWYSKNKEMNAFF